MLNPAWGVDLIIGGHSHTILEHPVKENNILIAQAGIGTDHIGRFDIIVDDYTNSIVDCCWQLIEISEKTANPDLKLLEYIQSFKKENQPEIQRTPHKICTTSYPIPAENKKHRLATLFLTSSGKLRSAILCSWDRGRSNLLNSVRQSRSVRFRACFPFNDSLKRFTIPGNQIKQIFAHVMRPEKPDGQGKCY